MFVGVLCEISSLNSFVKNTYDISICTKVPPAEDCQRHRHDASHPHTDSGGPGQYTGQISNVSEVGLSNLWSGFE